MQELFNYVYKSLIREAKKQERIKNPLKYRGYAPQGYRTDVSVNKIEGKAPVKGTGEADDGKTWVNRWRRKTTLLLQYMLTDPETNERLNALMNRVGENLESLRGTTNSLKRQDEIVNEYDYKISNIKLEIGKKIKVQKEILQKELESPVMFRIENFLKLYANDIIYKSNNKDQLKNTEKVLKSFKHLIDSTPYYNKDKITILDIVNRYRDGEYGLNGVIEQIKDIDEKYDTSEYLPPERKQEIKKLIYGYEDIVKGFETETETRRGYKKLRGFIYDRNEPGGVRELPLIPAEPKRRVVKGTMDSLNDLINSYEKLNIKKQEILDEIEPVKKNLDINYKQIADDFPAFINILKKLADKSAENFKNNFNKILFKGVKLKSEEQFKKNLLDLRSSDNLSRNDAIGFFVDLLNPKKLKEYLEMFAKSNLNSAGEVSIPLPETPDSPEQPQGEAETGKQLKYVRLFGYFQTLFKSASVSAQKKGYINNPGEFFRKELTKLEERLDRKASLQRIRIINPSYHAIITALKVSYQRFIDVLSKDRVLDGETKQNIIRLTDSHLKGNITVTQYKDYLREMLKQYDQKIEDVAIDISDEIDYEPGKGLKRKKINQTPLSNYISIGDTDTGSSDDDYSYYDDDDDEINISGDDEIELGDDEIELGDDEIELGDDEIELNDDEVEKPKKEIKYIDVNKLKNKRKKRGSRTYNTDIGGDIEI